MLQRVQRNPDFLDGQALHQGAAIRPGEVWNTAVAIGVPGDRQLQLQPSVTGRRCS
jgi:hypothetical protein